MTEEAEDRAIKSLKNKREKCSIMLLTNLSGADSWN